MQYRMLGSDEYPDRKQGDQCRKLGTRGKWEPTCWYGTGARSLDHEYRRPVRPAVIQSEVRRREC